MIRRLDIGARVNLFSAMGLDPNGRINYTSGTVNRKDGAYYYIKMDDPSGAIVERYLSEVESAFIDGLWRKLR
jgi:hypothetical protein